MNFVTASSLSTRKSADLLVIPFWKGKKGAEAASAMENPLSKLLEGPLSLRDFLGKEGEMLIVYASGQSEKRLALLGLGECEKITVERLRRAYAQVAKTCQKQKFKEINILPPSCEGMSTEDLVRGICEGLLLPNYAFTMLKHDSLKENKPEILAKATLIGINKQDLAKAQRYATLSESVNFVRDLVNGNADDITPQCLASAARDLEKTCKHVKTTLFDKKRIEKEKMGLLLAVNRGSFRDPVFAIIEYKGNPKSSDHTVVVGKGITFDTGGLNLKPTGSMETMKGDMAGAAAVLGIIQAASALGLKVNVTGVFASTENCIDALSFKPGDVYAGYSGKTVEISNTDAEGRLILADALAYTVEKLKPSRIIDLATLTGAVEIALGDEITGLMTNNDVLADLLVRAGSETGEKVWRLPLPEEYREALKSDIADIKSTGGRAGGCLKAGLFLQDFVGKTPWAHLDIAGTAFVSEAKRYQPKYATGIGVRLIISFLELL